MKYEQDKDGIISEGLTGSQLDDAIERLGAEKDFDTVESKNRLEKEQKEKELELRQEQEDAFCQEKKKVQGVATRHKREKLLQFMDRWKDDEAVQRVGKKLIDRIDASLEDEMAALEKEKDQKME